MDAVLYNGNEVIGKIKGIFEYLNINVEKLHEQERIDEVERILENKKREQSTLSLHDGEKLDAKDISRVELIKHNLSKPIELEIH